MGTRYAERADLVRFGLSADALVGVPTATQDEALDGASSVLDGYIASRKTLPLSAWGDDLRRYVCGIASYDIMVIRGFDPNSGSDEQLRKRFDDAIAWGKLFAAGGVESPDMADATPADATDERRSITITNTRRRWIR